MTNPRSDDESTDDPGDEAVREMHAADEANGEGRVDDDDSTS